MSGATARMPRRAVPFSLVLGDEPTGLVISRKGIKGQRTGTEYSQ